jgi:WD40 repeat protein
MTKAEEFEPGHADRVTVLHINFTSTRILTASADHRIKVWEREPETGEQSLTDTWTAHDADIRDVRMAFHSIRRLKLTGLGEMVGSDNGLKHCLYWQ